MIRAQKNQGILESQATHKSPERVLASWLLLFYLYLLFIIYLSEFLDNLSWFLIFRVGAGLSDRKIPFGPEKTYIVLNVSCREVYYLISEFQKFI